MAEDTEVRRTVSEAAARQLANATKTHAQWSGITPRWLVSFLPWTPVEAGIYRLNRVKESRSDAASEVECSPRHDRDLPETFVDYEEAPREYSLNAVTTVLDVQTRVSDLYSHPIDQIQEQLRLLIEKVKEKQEAELINNAQYGLLANSAPSQRIKTRKGPPTPDDLDGLEGTGILLGASESHCGIRSGMHPSRRAAANRQSVRFSISDLARFAVGSQRQAVCRRW